MIDRYGYVQGDDDRHVQEQAYMLRVLEDRERELAQIAQERREEHERRREQREIAEEARRQQEERDRQERERDRELAEEERERREQERRARARQDHLDREYMLTQEQEERERREQERRYRENQAKQGCYMYKLTLKLTSTHDEVDRDQYVRDLLERLCDKREEQGRDTHWNVEYVNDERGHRAEVRLITDTATTRREREDLQIAHLLRTREIARERAERELELRRSGDPAALQREGAEREANY